MKYQIDDSYRDDIPSAVLYRQTMDHYPKSAIGCFIISDVWDEEALIELKEKSEAWFLVGLQIDDSEFKRLDIIEGVIRCQPNEVDKVIRVLDVNSASTIIGIDVVDIKSLFEYGNSFQFIQASATGESISKSVKAATQQLVSQFIKARHAKRLLVTIESIESPSLEVFSYISEAVEALLSNDAYIYYSSRITDEPDCFCLKALYAEE
ncbi:MULTISPECIES: hypothetical protein [unclassified Psychrobacter]|uniref:hypothetical protein n=1 Tax=unclassified Psychrobacter TaxID=196806 RepID=UPI0027BAACFD|nr:hypothetical protein [Psychrobacter sp. van23A]WLW67287.1 hypothetical protein RAH45_05055 [Psychrobacter sp. van23A]